MCDFQSCEYQNKCYRKWRHAVKWISLSDVLVHTVQNTSSRILQPLNLKAFWLIEYLSNCVWRTTVVFIYVFPFIFCISVTSLHFSIHVFTYHVYSHNSPHNSFFSTEENFMNYLSLRTAFLSYTEQPLLYWLAISLSLYFSVVTVITTMFNYQNSAVSPHILCVSYDFDNTGRLLTWIALPTWSV